MSMIQGSTLVEQPLQESYALTSGYRTTRRFRGLEAPIRALYDSYNAQGSTCDLAQDGAGGANASLWTLTVQVQGEDPEVSWEIVSEAKSINVINTDKFTGLTPAERYSIENFEDLYTGSFITGSCLAKLGISSSLARKAFLLKLKGDDQMTVFIPTLKVNYVVANDYEIVDATSNVNVVHSTNTLQAVEAIPPRMWGAMPTSSTVTYTEMLDGTASVSTYNAGWLKGPATVQLAGKGKTVIQQEYRYVYCDVDVYGNMI